MNIPLVMASSRGHLDVVNRLLECELIDVNASDRNGFTALIEASRIGHLDVANRLLKCKQIDINLQCKYGNSALKWASKFNRLYLVERLDKFQKKMNIREGFKLFYTDSSLYVPVDLVELIIDFTT